MLLEAAGATLTKALITRLSGDAAGRVIKKREDRHALERAVDAATRATVKQYGGVLARYDVNAQFLEHEGSEEIGRILLPGRGPDARNLAQACVASLGGGPARSADQLVAPFEAFLAHLTEELGRYPPFRTCLHEVASTRSRRAGEPDEREFLEWLARRFEFLQTAGVGTTQHLQLKLLDVFVEPRAMPVQHAGVKWGTGAEQDRAFLRERLRNREISYEEYEARLDRLGLEHGGGERSDQDPVSVTDVIRHSQRVLVLGDPGTGKTTLMRYLVLRHAEALLAGETRVREDLGEARLPLYVRAGDFARSKHRDDGLSAFIAPFLSTTLECPVDRGRLDDLIARALRDGRCLVLIDGLDEVTTAQDRSQVVGSIANFVGAQQPRGNRFVCTSRISGYAASPLPPEFVAVRLSEMDDESIERFLRVYVPAIEHAEAATKDRAIAQREADTAVRGLVDAFRLSPGVRRLAANPLLLTALLLVHRTHGALPERRVDAYKAVTDVLGHTWRVKQGVPEVDLPDERRLTQWLTRLADWMHANRPEGSATLRDLLEQWGPLWAKLQREAWNAEVLDDADPAASDAGRAILDFVAEVEQHSGMLVERAPRRWGFPHLTFEEFYAGRALAFEGRASDRARRIRRRLHDPRYDEPILLALGLIGRDQPEELEAIFEAALLAEGDDAQDLSLIPSELEDLLGRDFRFALRALADDVPASPDLIDALLARALDEALDPDSRARYATYRGSLLERLGGLATLGAGARAADLLARRAGPELLGDQAMRSRFVEVAARCQPTPAVLEALTGILARSHNLDAANSAARVFGGQANLPEDIVERLTEIIAAGDEQRSGAIGAARVLAVQGSLARGVIERLTDIIATSQRRYSATSAAQVLGAQGLLAPAIRERLARIIATSENAHAAVSAAQVLGGQSELPAAAVRRLAEIIATSENVESAISAAQLLGGQGALPVSAIRRLLEIVTSPGDIPNVADSAAKVLGRQRLLDRGADESDLVIGWLIDIIATTDDGAAANAVARALGEQRSLTAPAVARLTEIIATSDSAPAAWGAAQALGRQAELPPHTIEELIEILGRREDRSATSSAAHVLARQGELATSAIERLTEIIATSENSGAVAGAAQLLGARREFLAATGGRLREIVAKGESSVAVVAAAQLIGAHGELPPVAVDRLREIVVTSANPAAVVDAAKLLEGRRELPAAALGRLVEVIATSANPYVAQRAAQVLEARRSFPAGIVDGLSEIVATSQNPVAVVSAASLLAARGELAAATIDRLHVIIATSHHQYTIRAAAHILEMQRVWPEATVGRLLAIIAAGENAAAAVVAAQMLAARRPIPVAAIDPLVEFAAGDLAYDARVDVIDALAKSPPSTHLVQSVLGLLTDDESAVRKAARDALAVIADRDGRWQDHVVEALTQMLYRAAAVPLDRYEDQSGHDYAYDELWRLMALRSGAHAVADR